VATESIEVSVFVPKSTPDEVYDAWFQNDEHSRFSGMRARMTRTEGAAFDLGEGQIQGTNRELEPGRRILQSWRAAAFPADSPDSLVQVDFAPEGDGTRVTLGHKDLPQGQAKAYQTYWRDTFLSEMARHFSEGRRAEEPAARRRERRPARKVAKTTRRAAAVGAAAATARRKKTAGRRLPKAARPKPGKATGKKTGVKQVRGAALGAKPGGKKTGRRSASEPTSRRVPGRQAARVAKTRKAGAPRPKKGGTKKKR